MKLLLVNPPLERYDAAELAPPLGLLELAHFARLRGLDAGILDLNLPRHRPAGDSSTAFYSYAFNLIASEQADILGFTSMGVNSHVALHLAALAHKRLGLPVILGGVHFRSIAAQLLELFPWIHAIPPFLQSSDTCRWWEPPDTPAQAFVSAEDLFKDIDLEPYFSSNPRRVLNFEAGRGCKYNCAFCYSPLAHKNRWVTREIHEAVHSLDFLSSILGARHAFLVEDNLGNDTQWLRALCHELSCAGLNLTWNGYCTLRDLSLELLPIVSSAGCTNLFVGVDVVDETQQRKWRKRFYHTPEALTRLLSEASNSALTLTCAFIIDLAEAASHATHATLEAALRVARQGAEVRLAALAYYPGTSLERDSQLSEQIYSEARPSILMDVPVVTVRNPIAKRFPELFPWHARPRLSESWEIGVLAISLAQDLLNDPSVVAAYDDGRQLWMHCRQTARLASKEFGFVHKLDLKAQLKELAMEVGLL